LRARRTPPSTDVIPAEIGLELAGVIRAAVAAGELPSAASTSTPNGTWRPAPPEAGGGPGSYATSLPFMLAKLTGADPSQVATLLAVGLRAVPWISDADVTGGGYITVTVTGACLAGLPARVVAAGPAVARSDALSGTTLRAPHMPELGAAPTWERAWRDQRAALVGKLAAAAGAEVAFIHGERKPAHASPGAGQSPLVRTALAYYGPDAVGYALARTATGDVAQVERQLGLPLDLSNPFVAVRYAHADAASTLRWARDLGMPLRGLEPAPGYELLPQELALAEIISWLPERVAAAGRRRRPAELVAHLEVLAGAWLDCKESCPALPFQGQSPPGEIVHAGDPPRSATTEARLGLASAARIGLAAGLDLLGVSAPARM
jgi:arginyl-tRNA synthetase